MLSGKGGEVWKETGGKMKSRKVFQTRLCLLVAALGLLNSGCSRMRIKENPSPENPYIEKLFLIMTRAEKQTIKSLRFPAEKSAFIRQFWELRDPVPATAENESRTEFENRVAFANEWFSDLGTFRGRTRMVQSHGDRGWQTDKGRIFIILGTPALVSYSDRPGTWEPMQLNRLQDYSSETWYYPRFQHLYVSFSKSIGGRWRAYFGPHLVEVINKIKLMMVSEAYRADFETAFRFKSRWEDGLIRFKIPPDCVNYKEEEGRLQAEFRISIQVFRNGCRAGSIETVRSFSYEEEDLARLGKIAFELPFSPRENGHYILEITVADTLSIRGIKHTKKLKFRTR
jgi:GWxTD domain-containing protein